eukprot:8921566-Lingulodinium_polyedra.AAC.1
MTSTRATESKGSRAHQFPQSSQFRVRTPNPGGHTNSLSRGCSNNCPVLLLHPSGRICRDAR